MNSRLIQNYKKNLGISHGMCLYQVMMTLHFSNDVEKRFLNTQNTKIENCVIIASLKSETMVKLIYRIPGPCLLISCLPGSTLKTHVESLGRPCDVNKRSQRLAWKTCYQKTLT